jgi:hypothetical protein
MSTPSALKIIAAAQRLYGENSDDDIEIDGWPLFAGDAAEAEAEAVIDRPEDPDGTRGAWVKAWLWVPYSEVED